jgi:hypothetical protein
MKKVYGDKKSVAAYQKTGFLLVYPSGSVRAPK